MSAGDTWRPTEKRGLITTAAARGLDHARDYSKERLSSGQRML
jgi:hypothetical protein